MKARQSLKTGRHSTIVDSEDYRAGHAAGVREAKAGIAEAIAAACATEMADVPAKHKAPNFDGYYLPFGLVYRQAAQIASAWKPAKAGKGE